MQDIKEVFNKEILGKEPTIYTEILKISYTLYIFTQTILI